MRWRAIIFILLLNLFTLYAKKYPTLAGVKERVQEVTFDINTQYKTKNISPKLTSLDLDGDGEVTQKDLACYFIYLWNCGILGKRDKLLASTTARLYSYLLTNGKTVYVCAVFYEEKLTKKRKKKEVEEDKSAEEVEVLLGEGGLEKVGIVMNKKKRRKVRPMVYYCIPKVSEEGEGERCFDAWYIIKNVFNITTAFNSKRLVDAEEEFTKTSIGDVEQLSEKLRIKEMKFYAKYKLDPESYKE